jgi:hypothetical protein
VPEDDQGSLVADRLPALTRNVKEHKWGSGRIRRNVPISVLRLHCAEICRKFANPASTTLERRTRAGALVSIAQAICLFVGRDSSSASPMRQCTRAPGHASLKNGCAAFSALLCSGALGRGALTGIDIKSLVDTQEWFRLPESRRRYATDAVAFAYRLLRDQPELFTGRKEVGHESIVNWLLPHLAEAKTG